MAALRDVRDSTDIFRNLIRGSEKRVGTAMDTFHGPIGADDPIFEVKVAPRSDRVQKFPLDVGTLLRVHQPKEQVIRNIGSERADAKDPEMLARPEHLAGRRVPGPATRPSERLTECQVVHTASELLLLLLVLPQLPR